MLRQVLVSVLALASVVLTSSGNGGTAQAGCAAGCRARQWVAVPYRARRSRGSSPGRRLDDGWRARRRPDRPDGAEKLLDPYLGDNEAKVQWVGLSDWQYQTEIDVSPATLGRDHVDLVFEGLDTFAEVKVNGISILKADNMFRTWRVPVKGVLHAGKNTIEVDLASPIKTMAPKVAAMPYVMPGAYDSAFGDEAPGHDSSTYVRKAGYQYGWDWGPRVVALGTLEAGQAGSSTTARASMIFTSPRSISTIRSRRSKPPSISLRTASSRPA